MLKNQQFYILKFSSDRLKKSNYNIEISVDNARKNSEIITINNSELIRTLFNYKKINFSQKELDNLIILKKKIKKAENTEKNKIKLEQITTKIEKILFIEDLVNIEFTNKSHYLKILKQKGFYINGIRFVPFMASAGMIRKNTAMFINNNVKHPLMDILENERDETAPMASSKFGAYFSLYSSSTLPVSFPKFAVIPDKEIESIRNIDFVTYQGVDQDDKVENLTQPIKTNAWDGQGLISPKLAKRWSEELELDYIFSGAIIRAPYMKGLVVTFDFHKFATEIAKTTTFTDVYGDEQDIQNVDMIVSESMFKLWFGYKSTDEYINKCYYNNLGFSIAKVNPKKEKSHSRTSYQFLQVLNLNETDVARLCEPTIDWFRGVSGDNPKDMLIYSTGEHIFDPKDFNKLDVSVKAILMNPELSKDRYIQKRFKKSIGKKKKESYMGSILINANYQFMIGDPYYQACHIFKLDETLHQPILKDGQHYSEYWLNKNINKATAIRSPIVHHSELGILHFQDNCETREWFQYIHSGIIFPANGIGMDCAIHGGADFDGDLICTINNKIMMKGKIDGVPIMYESTSAEKKIIDSRDDDEQVKSQLNGYNSKVGFATNISSSLYSLLDEFPARSKEHNAILDRLKIGRVIQGEIIDGVKGLKVPPFRNHWTKHKKIHSGMSTEEKEKWEFYNKIVCKVRPAFFRFLYQHYMTDYNREIKKYNIYSHLQFNKSFKNIFKSPETVEESRLLDSYKWHTFFLDNNSVVNKISRYMRTTLALVNRYVSKQGKESDWTILKNKEHELNPYSTSQMKHYLQEYKAFKKGLRHDLVNSYGNLDSFISYLKKECVSNISSNESELADYALEVTYNGEVGMVEFAWKMFPDGIIENIMKSSLDKIYFPVQDDNGDIEYLWNKYSLKEFSVEDLYDEK